MYDLLFKNGLLIDGSGAPAFQADIALHQSRIAAIGDLGDSPARQTIDANGRYICPGLIDIHTHSDLTLALDGRAYSSLAQGITTQIMGNCGVSAAPTREGDPYYVAFHRIHIYVLKGLPQHHSHGQISVLVTRPNQEFDINLTMEIKEFRPMSKGGFRQTSDDRPCSVCDRSFVSV